MAKVLTMASQVLCGVSAPKLHGGTVTTTSSAKLTVSNNAVLLSTSLGAVAGCLNAPPPMGATPCTKVLTVLPVSMATKLLAGGSGVLLESTLKGTTLGVPVGTLSATAIQNKLTAV
jgi:hypothetical protein